MLTQHSEKIDKFLIVFVVVMVVLAGMVIFTFRSIFSASNTAYDLNPSTLDADLKINKDKLNEAYTWAFEKETVDLEL